MSAEATHLPLSVQQSNAKHDKGDTITEVRENEGYAHLLPAQEGWQDIATGPSTGDASRR